MWSATLYIKLTPADKCNIWEETGKFWQICKSVFFARLMAKLNRNYLT